MTIGSAKLDKMLNMGKSHNDKSGLGFKGESSTSSSLKTKFVKALDPKPPVLESPKSPKPKRFVPTCHHCGKLGHIRPNCYNLKKMSRNPPLVNKGPQIKRFIPICHNCGKNGHIRPNCLAPKRTLAISPPLFAKVDSRKSSSRPSPLVDDTSLHIQIKSLMDEVAKISKLIDTKASNDTPSSSTQKVWVKKNDGC
ncbi:hypothetical protein M0R45_006607 [Rubus argutus]|uniref:CCHC-type domain-containing protein n=1 Tax=Rubus argutus TaxID=59490 RepID=A0AAW1YRE6_RUBAR